MYGLDIIMGWVDVAVRVVVYDSSSTGLLSRERILRVALCVIPDVLGCFLALFTVSHGTSQKFDNSI
jgi:hypothetical protein